MELSILSRPAVLLGVSLGGFLDGIVLHQILGWHHLICRTETCQPDSLAMVRQQTTEDGLFHLAMWLLIVVAVWLLNRVPAPLSARRLWGGALVGWGAFNFIEGLVDHQLLGLHHVMPASSNYLAWDIAFLASGLLLAAIGYSVAKGDRRSSVHVGT